MSMGSFNPHRMYKQEDAMANAEAMTMLQKLRGESFDKVTNSVDEYGQSRQRGKVAELLGTDAYKSANPEDAMALVMQKTGGRDLGENHRKNMDVSYTGKGDVRKNTWDEEAATLSNSRANARQAQGNSNAIALEGLRQKNKIALGLANETISTDGGKSKKLFMKALATTTDPKIREQMIQEGYLGGFLNKNDRIAMEKLGIMPEQSGSSSNKKRKYGTALWGANKNYRAQTPKVKKFMDSKYSPLVTEAKDGYYFQGRKLDDIYLAELEAKGTL